MKSSFETHSEEETLRLAEKIGREFAAGTIAALTGEIGCGKTVFIKGLSRGLGVKNPSEVKSPTFVLLHQYAGKFPIQHFDLYRLERENDLDAIGFDDFVANPNAVSLIEWADRAPKRIPRGAFWIQITILGPNSRSISIRN